METADSITRPLRTIFSAFNVTEFRREQPFLLCTSLRHHFMHRKIGTERIRACVRYTETSQELLHFSILAVFTVKTIENNINLAQNTFGRSWAATVMPDALAVYVNVACRVSFLRKIREDGGAGPKRDIMFS